MHMKSIFLTSLFIIAVCGFVSCADEPDVKIVTGNTGNNEMTLQTKVNKDSIAVNKKDIQVLYR